MLFRANWEEGICNIDKFCEEPFTKPLVREVSCKGDGSMEVADVLLEALRMAEM